MGVKASSLILIDMLTGMCGGALDVPLTENDIFDENGEIVDDKFDEYLVQQDDEDEAKKKVCLALASMVGQRMKRKREDLLEAKRLGTRPSKKTRIMRPRWYADLVTGMRRPKTPKMSVPSCFLWIHPRNRLGSCSITSVGCQMWRYNHQEDSSGC